jgi:hypothetical protein
METLKEKEIIEKARETIKTFPNKKTKIHEEIIELVEDWDLRDKWEKEHKAHNEKLQEKYKEIEPLIEEITEAEKRLNDVEYKLNRFIDKIFQEKILEETNKYKNYVIIEAEEAKKGDVDSITRSNARPIDSHNTIYKLIQQQEELKAESPKEKLSKLRAILKDSYWIRDITWLKNEYYDDYKRDDEKKLLTRLNRLEKNNK